MQVTNVFSKRIKNHKKIFNIYHNNIRRFKSRNILNSVKTVSYLTSKSQMLCCLCKGYSVCPHRNHGSLVSKPVIANIHQSSSQICMALNKIQYGGRVKLTSQYLYLILLCFFCFFFWTIGEICIWPFFSTIQKYIHYTLNFFSRSLILYMRVALKALFLPRLWS